MDDEILILATSWQPDRKSFLEALGISPHGLGSQLLGEVFESFFLHSIDLRREYTRYYSVEYGTLSKYIEAVYGQALGEIDLEKDHIFLIKNFPQIVDRHYEGSKLDTILTCVKRLEGGYENQA